MARTALRPSILAAVVATVAAGCGSAPPIDRPRQLVLGDGWTETPLDTELARLACGSGENCEDVCRVRAHVIEPGGRTRDVEHRIGRGARLVVTVRSDGTLSVRATIERNEDRLYAMLELEHRGALDEDDAIRALARPGSGVLTEGARVTRTYERLGAAAYVLHEVGGAVRTVRFERQEELDGAVHRGRIRAARYTADTRAWMDGRTRSIESVHVRADHDRSRSSATEQLDERGRVVRTRRSVEPSWQRGEAIEESELEYDGDDALPSALTWWWSGEPHRQQLAPRGLSRLWEIGRDAQGRPTTYRFRSEDAEGDDVIAIARDAAGRITSIREHTRWGTSSALEIARDERGQVIRETGTWTGRDGAGWARTLARTFDAAGRLVRAESTVRSRESEEAPEEVSSTTATYDFGDLCSPDAIVADELDLLPTLDDRVDYVP